MSIFLAGGDSKPVKDTSDELDATETVNIYHPGQRGVPFSVVLDACRILANNQDGTLGVVDADVDLAPPDDDKSLLPPGHYTYRVTGGEVCYAVCTSFRAWTPPRWILRGMNAITNNAGGINSPPNCLALRADLNGAGMGKGHFVLAPYNGTAVCVCLTTEMADFAVEYYLRAIKIPPRIHPMNVYVRFAWGLFRGLQTLLRDLSRDQSVVIIQEPNFSDVTPTPKRKHTEGSHARREEQEGNTDGGDKKQGHGQGNAGEGPLLTDDDDSPQESSDDNVLQPSLDVDTWTERDVEIAEGLDAHLDGRPLAPYEQAAGMYHGYSKVIRLKHEYRKQHPEVSALRSARVARMGEDDDEQSI
ncbi:hypothetical protein B0H10DRAFT_2006727 [Mycena sp. CBHHK59/15]|nr:hypothetical protein B0H10DRAFT_2006727 [Mycena sp. CBHHK59/15]